MALTTDPGQVTTPSTTPANDAIAWTCHDTNYIADGNDAPIPAKGILVDTAGDYAVTTMGGTDITIYLAAGVIHPIRLKRVKATGSADTAVVIVY